MTVTKAKLRQAHICILLPDIDKLCPPLLFSLSLSLSLSLSQIIELEEDEPKLFTKTIQPKKRKEKKELFTKTNKNQYIKTIFLARQKAYKNIY